MNFNVRIFVKSCSKPIYILITLIDYTLNISLLLSFIGNCTQHQAVKHVLITLNKSAFSRKSKKRFIVKYLGWMG